MSTKNKRWRHWELPDLREAVHKSYNVLEEIADALEDRWRETHGRGDKMTSSCTSTKGSTSRHTIINLHTGDMIWYETAVYVPELFPEQTHAPEIVFNIRTTCVAALTKNEHRRLLRMQHTLENQFNKTLQDISEMSLLVTLSEE